MLLGFKKEENLDQKKGFKDGSHLTCRGFFHFIQVCLEVILASKNSHRSIFFQDSTVVETSALGPPTREAATVRFKALAAHTVHLRCGRS